MDYDVRTGTARALPEAQVAAEVARQMLSGLRAERGAAPLHEAVRLALAANMPIAEIERTSGYTRPTIYAAKKAIEHEGSTGADQTLLARQVLVVIGTVEGAMPLVEVANRLRYSTGLIHQALLALRAQKMCEIDGRPASDPNALSATITLHGLDVLRSLFDDLYLRRPDAFSVYLRVDPKHRSKIQAAAAGVMSAHEHTVLDATVAPSSMTGPELALAVHAPSSRTALTIVHDLWNEIVDRAQLGGAGPAWITALIPPAPLAASESGALDAFADAITENSPETAFEITRARRRFAGGVSEAGVAARCVTAAATALRRTVGSANDPRPITDGEQAAAELFPASTVPVKRGHETVRRATVEALTLAADRLGPYRGGELGSIKSPTGQPRVLEEIHPSSEDVVAMARAAGVAVGAAAKAGVLDAAELMSAVVRGA